jgi:AMP-binding enzyme C-terminal domain
MVYRSADLLSTRLEPDPFFSAGCVKNSIGVTIGVDVVEPNTVERSVGKMRRIVDQRPAR